MNKHEIGGERPPAYMMGKGTNAATVRAIWLRNNNPHLYFHEEVRLAKARLSRSKNIWGENVTYGRTKDAYQALLYAERRLDAYHEQERAEQDLADLDAKYHDRLPLGANCHLCGVEHAAINPEALGR